MQCSTQYYTNTIHSNRIQYSTTQYNTAQHKTTTHYYPTEYDTILHNTIQYNTTQYNTSANCVRGYIQVWGGAPAQLRGDAAGHRGEQEGEQRNRIRTR